MIDNRQLAGLSLLKQHNLDALVFFDLHNVRYLCGFTGTDGALVLTSRGSWFTTDSRYTAQAESEVRADHIRQHRVKLDSVTDILKAAGTHRIGFEAQTLAYATVEKLKERSPTSWQWVPLGEELEGLRHCKDAQEIEALESAARLNAIAFQEIVPQIRPGATERDIALALEFSLKRLGGEEKAFDYIVASGERGAMPHGVASGKRLAAGELVTIDFGTRVNGYHSDETVTLALGEVSERQREIFDIVLKAHDLAMDAVKPGVALSDIDSVARDYIAERRLGDYFGHGLGHGVGLDVHEYPVVSPRSGAEAEVGAVFTIEPGIYIPGLGGVRIEDTVLVTESGYRPLTRIDKKYRQIAV
ncbi:MAG: Xaa-Pro peptidase family protein [Desulfuromonadales bacterium]